MDQKNQSTAGAAGFAVIAASDLNIALAAAGNEMEAEIAVAGVLVEGSLSKKVQPDVNLANLNY